MPEVYSLGESLLDIIFQNGEIKSAKPGGSMLNSSISLSRSEVSVSFISEFGFDDAGELINDFLNSNGVNSKYINRYSDGKTPIALAFLDKNKDASYSFYKQYPEQRLDITIPDFKVDNILLFGSFYSLQSEIRDKVVEIIQAAKNNKSLIVYDPNIRNPHKKEIQYLKEKLEENLAFSNIVRASDQDFVNIFDINDAERAWDHCRKYGVEHLIYTMNKNGVYHYYSDQCQYYPARDIKAISTIGAGDSFNAGLIKGILDSGSSIDWDKAITLGIEFATEVCMSMDNYIKPRI